MHSCRLLMEIPSTERHRAIHDIIAIGVLKGIGGEHQFRILRILRIISFFSRSIDSSEQANQPRKIDRFGFFDFSVRKWSFSILNDGLICKNRTKNQNDNRPQERIEKKLRKTDCFNFQRKIPDFELEFQMIDEIRISFECPKLSGKCSWHETKLDHLPR